MAHQQPLSVRKVLRKIWGAWFYFNLAFIFFPLYPFFLIFLSHPKTYKYAHFCRKIWGWVLFFNTGMYLKRHFEHKLNPKKTYIIVSNHSSYMDIPSLTCGIPNDLSYMAKQELTKVPLFGRFFHTIDIAVNRKSATASHKAFMKAAEQLKHGKRSLVIYPEGTIPAHAPKLGKFKAGPFRLAIENNVEILPVTLADNWYHLPDNGTWEGWPGVVNMYIHRPIPTTGLNLNDEEELKQKVFSIIESKLIEHGSYERAGR